MNTGTRSHVTRAIGRCLLSLAVVISSASVSAALRQFDAAVDPPVLEEPVREKPDVGEPVVEEPVVETAARRPFDDVVGPVVLDDRVVEIASVMGGFEWSVDMPWRMEPPWDKLPINIAFHDVAEQKDGYVVPDDLSFCDMLIAIGRPDGTSVFPTGGITYFPVTDLHELERSAKWPASSDGPAFHTVRRAWRGEIITPEDLRVGGTAEWHATGLLDISFLPAGDYVFTVHAILANAGHCPRWFDQTSDDALDFNNPYTFQALFGLYHKPYGWPGHWFSNTFQVHLAQQPLPRFDSGWVYGDLHYHSQGTDNEGESAYSYRTVIQAMKAMGLDFIVASDHASSSDQVTDIDAIFVDQLPDDLPYLPDWEWVKDMILDAVNDVSVPTETSIDAARDMNPRRWRYLHHWLNGPDGVNRQVTSSGGSSGMGLENAVAYAFAPHPGFPGSVLSSPPRAPQIFLGGEVDAIPEISAQEAANQSFPYGNRKTYPWARACTDIPDIFLTLINYTTFDVCPSPNVLLDPASEGGRYLLRDIQGLASPAFFARQHFIHIPADPTRDDAFVASETTRYGGAHRRLKDILAQDYEEGGKGYLFLAHPMIAASGNGFSRLGPDLVPYSDAQLMTAFQSPYFLGLQLWNEDSRLETKPSPGGFPMTSWAGWGQKKDSSQLSALHHGAATWDKTLLWGMNSSKTAGLSWLPAGMPRPVYMAGGSDAHGDINFRREGSITGWSSSNDTALGKPRNLLFVGSDRPQPVDGAMTISQTQVVEALRTGQFSVTDGPALRIAIDQNGNNVIDATDTPMGGVVDLGSSIPLLVEWKSTSEFGPVTSIDVYVGSQAGTADGAMWAPSGHGARGSGDYSGTLATDIPDGTGRVYRELNDGYFLDQNGKLRIAVPAAEGMRGVRKVVLNRADYPIVRKECHEETTTTPPQCWTDYRGFRHCTKPIVTTRTVCQATSVTPAERVFLRAFARTASTARVLAGTVPLERFAYTNPIWVRPSAFDRPWVFEGSLSETFTLAR